LICAVAITASWQKVLTLALSPTDVATVPRIHHHHFKLCPLFLRIPMISFPLLPGVSPPAPWQPPQPATIPTTTAADSIDAPAYSNAMRQDKAIANQPSWQVCSLLDPKPLRAWPSSIHSQ
ncbi:hypothetical protein S245_059075, partial [Arachis hypogaea]